MTGLAIARACPGCRAESADGATQCSACGRPLSSPFLQSGHVLASRYVVLGPLGFGGMGMVYKAHDRKGGDSVAVKVLRPDTGPAADLAPRFLQEGRLALKVSHPHVCRIYECGEDHGLHYIAMELVEGSDLKHEIAECGAFPGEKAYELALQIVEGLKAIHDVGVVHRDLKTPNIMLDSRQVVKLMDFGLAKEWTAVGRGLTATGQVVGTPEYMSPEQVRGLPLDGRSDLYALGVVLFELFTGQVPFHGEDPVATLLKQVQEPPPLEGPRAVLLPAELRPILQALLAKRPSERPASAGEVAEMLRQAQALFDPDTIPTVITGLPRAELRLVPSLPGGAAAASMASPRRPSEAAVLIPPLLRALKHSDRDIRAGGAQALGQMGADGRAAVGALAEALKDPEHGVRLQAVRALGNIGRGALWVRASVSALRADPDPQVRGAALRALSQIGPDDGGRPYLLPPPVARIAVRADERVPEVLRSDGPSPYRRPTRSLRRLKRRLRVAWPLVAAAALFLVTIALLLTGTGGRRELDASVVAPPATAAELALRDFDRRLRRLERLEDNVQGTARKALRPIPPSSLAAAPKEAPPVAAPEKMPRALRAVAPDPGLDAASEYSELTRRGALVSLSDPGVTPPVGIRTPPPPYPAVARRGRVEGSVEVSLLVDENGKVSGAQWVRGPMALKKDTLDHLQGWKYRPAQKEGVPVKVRLPVRITFRLW